MGNDKKKKNSKTTGANVDDHRKERHHLAQGTGSADSAAAAGPGCISPTGCLLGKEISINEVIGVRVGGDGGVGNAVANAQDKYVKVFCTNQEKCKLVPFMHRECFEKWEETLLRQFRVRNVTRNWNDDKIQHALWSSDGGTYIHRTRKCSCGGFLTKVDPEDEELPKPTEKAQKKAVKAAAEPESSSKKRLPMLVNLPKSKKMQFKVHSGESGSYAAKMYTSNDCNEMANRKKLRERQEQFEDEERRKRDERKEQWKQFDESIGAKPSAAGGFKKSTTMKPHSAATSAAARRAEPMASNGFASLGRLARGERESFSSSTGGGGGGGEDNGFWAPSPTGGSSGGATENRWGLTSPGLFSDATRLGSRPHSELFDFDDQENDEETDEIITDEELISEIRDLLMSLGGQLELSDPLLTGIVGRRSSMDLMVAIADSGGLGQWLSQRAEFDVDNGRVRLCRNVKREPARLNSTGRIESITNTYGTIYCASYDCSIFFDDDLATFDSLKKGDIVKVEALEYRSLAHAFRWKALAVVVLQRDTSSSSSSSIAQSQSNGMLNTFASTVSSGMQRPLSDYQSTKTRPLAALPQPQPQPPPTPPTADSTEIEDRPFWASDDEDDDPTIGSHHSSVSIDQQRMQIDRPAVAIMNGGGGGGIRSTSGSGEQFWADEQQEQWPRGMQPSGTFRPVPSIDQRRDRQSGDSESSQRSIDQELSPNQRAIDQQSVEQAIGRQSSVNLGIAQQSSINHEIAHHHQQPPSIPPSVGARQRHDARLSNLGAAQQSSSSPRSFADSNATPSVVVANNSGTPIATAHPIGDDFEVMLKQLTTAYGLRRSPQPGCEYGGENDYDNVLDMVKSWDI